jgi:hypothetical protein
MHVPQHGGAGPPGAKQSLNPKTQAFRKHDLQQSSFSKQCAYGRPAPTLSTK